MTWINDLVLLFFPSNCLVCGKRLHGPGEILCFTCETELPRTGFEKDQKNPVSQIFWGRVPVIYGTSLLRFEKGSSCQSLLHDLKYRGNRKAGLYLGRLLGQALLCSSYSNSDLIIPVPLHPRKFRERGYNQSEIIARGLTEITGIPLAAGIIKRKDYSSSQTVMNRQERFENISEAFMLCDPSPDLNDKKILMIDDVVTTGATLEACCQVLSRHFKCRICIATVFCA
ncbi:MAG: phosphoribosyltransferase family protein [Bacteroidales bacterium]|nr:phosphoribosyltransferase family protein [Bacteroidales bacterium]